MVEVDSGSGEDGAGESHGEKGGTTVTTINTFFKRSGFLTTLDSLKQLSYTLIF